MRLFATTRLLLLLVLAAPWAQAAEFTPAQRAEIVAIVVEIEAAGAGNCFPKITHGNPAGERFNAPRFRFRRRDLLDGACRITGLPSHAAEFL